MQAPAVTHRSHSANVTSRRPIAKVLFYGHFMNRRFGGLGVRAHLVLAGRDHDELDALWAVAKSLSRQALACPDWAEQIDPPSKIPLRAPTTAATVLAIRPCDRSCGTCSLQNKSAA